MSTITKEFTKEQLQQIIETDHVQCGEASALARIALASLEAEPVAYMYKDNLHSDARFSLHTRFGNWSQEDINEYEITEIPLYAAPPASVENTKLERKAAILDALYEKYNIESLDDFVEWKRNHIAELEAAPPAPVIPRDLEEFIFTIVNAMADEKLRNDESELFSLAKKYIEHAKSKLSAAMLQGADDVGSWNNNKNTPSLREAVGAIRNSGIAIDAEKILAERDALNSPVIPDGWVACSERMPAEYNYDIWIYSPRKGVCHGVAYAGDNQFMDDECQFKIDDATHWMPMIMPAAPQQEVK